MYERHEREERQEHSRRATGANRPLPLRFGLVRLDLDGDNEASRAESLWRLHATVTSQPAGLPGEGLVVRLDRGDMVWLQGYCHVLSAIAEFALAHESQGSVDVIAPFLFSRPKVRELPVGMYPGDERLYHSRPIADSTDAVRCRPPHPVPGHVRHGLPSPRMKA